MVDREPRQRRLVRLQRVARQARPADRTQEPPDLSADRRGAVPLRLHAGISLPDYRPIGITRRLGSVKQPPPKPTRLEYERVFWKDRTGVEHRSRAPADSHSDLLELARLVDNPELADRLQRAYGRGARILALEIADREMILRALEDGPATTALAELRGVLLAEHVGRVRDGLV